MHEIWDWKLMRPRRNTCERASNQMGKSDNDPDRCNQAVQV